MKDHKLQTAPLLDLSTGNETGWVLTKQGSIDLEDDFEDEDDEQLFN